MIGSLKIFVRYVAWMIIRITSLFVPKEPRRWLFRSNPVYDGNSRALYDYVRVCQPDIEAVWIFGGRKGASVGSYLDKNQVQNARVYSLRWLYYLLTARVLIGTHQLMPNKTSKRQVAVNLWHGMPIKGVGLLENRNQAKQARKELARGAAAMDITIATSSITRATLSMQLGIPPDRIHITGQPRTDLFTHRSDDARNFLTEALGIEPDAKMIFMLPTFRASESLGLNDGMSLTDQLDDPSALSWLNASLREYSAHLIIKPHPHDNALPELFSATDNIHLLPDRTLRNAGVELYALLSASDALVTDYSSVFIDYLLLDRPMVFFVKDISEYQETRPFVYEPFDLWTPGEKASSVTELKAALESILSGNDVYRERRQVLKSIFHKYCDGRASERIFKLIQSKL